MTAAFLPLSARLGLTRTAGRLALAAALLPAAPALAADPAAEPAAVAATADLGPDITVTARHRQEKLQDVPLAITAVNGAALATQHLDRVADYTLKVPNFSALQQNTRVSGLFIRGLGGNASNDGAEGGVGLIVDNVFFTHVGFSWLDFVDLDGIEVVRGPQGTLLGKNTTIGAVIVKTAQPSFTPSLTATASYGENNQYQIRANATGALIPDTLAFRLTAATSQGGGWIPNAVDGVKYLNNNRWSVRGQLLFTPAPGITSRLIAEHYESHEYNNFYPPQADVTTNLKPDGSAYTTAANPTGARTSWSSKLTNLFGYSPSFAVPYDANLDTQQRLTSRVDGVSNELNADIGTAAKLTAITAWRRLYFRPYNDSDYSPYPIDRAGYDVDVNQYSQEIRLASAKGHLLDWTVGAYYLHEDLRSNLRQIFYSDATEFFLNSAAANPAILNNLEYDRDGRLHIDSIAGFGQATAHLTDRLSLTAGLRYTHETKSVNVYGYALGGDAVSGPAAATRAALEGNFGGTSAAQAGAYHLYDRQNTGSFAWLVNPAFKLNRNVLIYGSASYGEKSGAANTSALASQAAVVLTQPEKSLDFEAGIKTSWWHDRLIANLNFYNNTISNYQDAQIDTANPTYGSYLSNVGKVRLRGVELETAFKPIPVLSIDVNAAYNNAKYLSYQNAPAPIEYQAYLASVKGVAGSATTLSLTGQQIRNAPKWTVQAGASLDQPLTATLHLTGYANTTWKSRIAFINPLSAYGWQAPYAIVNAGLGLKTTDERWALNLWSKNLFNKIYAATYAAATAAAPVIEILGDRRSYGVSLTHRF